MKVARLTLGIWAIAGIVGYAQSQSPRVKIKEKKFLTSDKIEVIGEVGFLEVPENRSNPNSRTIKVKFVRLKSLSDDPKEPLIYLEGGGSAATWQAEEPDYLKDWLPLLEVSDVILVDQRGTADKKLTWIWKDDYPENFFVSSEAASTHYQKMTSMALESFAQKEIDVQGYNVVESARDVEELRVALGINRYSIFGFSYGSHLGMALIKTYGGNIVNAIFAGADGLNHYFNYPSLLDEHFEKISMMVREDSVVQKEIPDLGKLLNDVMNKLEQNPAVLRIKNPLTRKEMRVKVGSFGLALILRLDIDDASDIPVIPRLLYSIDQGDYSLLQWFVQKRIVFAFAVPGNGINQGVSAGASPERWNQILKEADESIFGDVVNFPFSDAKMVWPETDIGINMEEPLKSKVRTLFISGDLDCRTPVSQADEIAKGFANSTHLVVKNAGHEQAMWNLKIFDEAIPQFLKGEDVSQTKAENKRIRFISIEEKDAQLHPSLSTQ